MTARYGAVRGSLGHCAVVTPQPLSELPHPAGRIPVLGDVTSVDRHKPTQHETELTRELGPIFQRLLLGERLIVVGGAKLANQTLDERNWGRALVGPLAKLREVAGAGLFTAKTKDPLWGQARRILTPGFSQTAMRTYHDATASVAADLSARWEKEPTVDVHQDTTAATLEVIGRAGFSQRMGLLGDTCQAVTGTEEFLEALGRALTWARVDQRSTHHRPDPGDAQCPRPPPRRGDRPPICGNHHRGQAARGRHRHHRPARTHAEHSRPRDRCQPAAGQRARSGVLSLAAQRDPEVWGDDADTFRADRFVGERLTASSDKYFAPWGTGPRSCIGRQFALHETTLLIAALISRFRLHLADPATQLSMRERATLRPEPFTIVATRRR